ncbi:MAG: hypothetical protein Q7R96_00105 [Nanoarchaeota archaeon]|nr:hypothetical protein [Nanoarchaeota archaeon]
MPSQRRLLNPAVLGKYSAERVLQNIDFDGLQEKQLQVEVCVYLGRRLPSKMTAEYHGPITAKIESYRGDKSIVVESIMLPAPKYFPSMFPRTAVPEGTVPLSMLLDVPDNIELHIVARTPEEYVGIEALRSYVLPKLLQRGYASNMNTDHTSEFWLYVAKDIAKDKSEHDVLHIAPEGLYVRENLVIDGIRVFGKSDLELLARLTPSQFLEHDKD